MSNIIIDMTRAALIFLVFLSSISFVKGQVTFIEEPEITAIMNKLELEGKSDPYIDGWRIKIISTTDRRAFENARYLMQRTYPDHTFTTQYENPYYSIKVGAFETRIDVEYWLVRLKQDFASALPFRDRILKEDLFVR